MINRARPEMEVYALKFEEQRMSVYLNEKSYHQVIQQNHLGQGCLSTH